MSRGLPLPVRRLRWIGIGLLVIYGVLGLRLLKIQLFDHPDLATRAERQQVGTTRIQNPRGTIRDRHGEPLVLDYPGWDVCVRIRGGGDALPSLVDRVAILARAFGVTEGEVAERIARLDSAHWLEWMRGVQDPAIVDFASAHAGWVSVTRRNMRLQPNFPLAEGLLGRCGARGTGGTRNLIGLEKVLDPYLASRDTVVRGFRDGHRAEVSLVREEEVVRPGRAGADVDLTLDREVQEVLERSLAAIVDRHAPQPGVGGVVLDADTGEVLALASLPHSRSLRDWDYSGDGSFGTRPWMVPLTYVSPPGSTFKPFTIGRALECDDPISLDDVIDCGKPEGTRGPVSLGRRTVRNFKGKRYGDVTVAESLFASYNIGLARIGQRLGVAEMADLLHAVGFAPRGDRGRSYFDLPEPWGALGARAGATSNRRDWRPGYSDIAWSFGQEMSMTLLQLAYAYTAIATDGVLRTPTLVKALRYPDGTVRPSPFETRRTRLFRPETVAAIRDTLANAFTAEEGTLHRIYRDYPELFEGALLCGKTGTATEEEPRMRAQLERPEYAKHSENIVQLVVLGQSATGGTRYIVALTAPHPTGKSRRYTSAGQVLGETGVRLMRFLLDRPAPAPRARSAVPVGAVPIARVGIQDSGAAIR